MQNACTSMNKSWTAACPGANQDAISKRNQASKTGRRTINNAVPDETLQKHAHQANQAVLHVLVLACRMARQEAAQCSMRTAFTPVHQRALVASHEEMQLEM